MKQKVILRTINGQQDINKVFADIDAIAWGLSVMIICKTPREIEIMREAGRIVALTHQELKKHITPGITTKELDAIAEEFIRKHDAIPSFKGYNGFRGSICASVNEELVHGIPGESCTKRRRHHQYRYRCEIQWIPW